MRLGRVTLPGLAVLIAVLALAMSGCSPGGSATLSLSPTASTSPSATPTPTSPPTPTHATSPTPTPSQLMGLTARPIGSVEGAPTGYLEYLPAGGSVDAPLLVFMHGGGQGGDGSERQLARVSELGVPPLIEDGSWPAERPFVVLSPQVSEADTEDCQTADDLDAFLTWAVEHYGVDPTRVYLTGLSCGAIGIWDYLAEHGDELVAAAVPIAGHLEDAFPEAGCELGNVPAWLFHGEQDEVVPVSFVEDRVAELQACTSPPPTELQLTLYRDADHDSWSRTYDLSAGHDIYAWLLDHSRP